MENLRRRWREQDGYAEVLKISLPLMASLASTTLMQFTDRLFLSHYSVEAIAAAVPAAFANLVLLLGLMGTIAYTNVFIAQFTGARLFGRIGSAVWQGVYLSLLGGILLYAVAGMGGEIFSLAGHEPAVREQEVVYFGILTRGGVWPLLSASMASFFSGLGRTRILMLASFAGVAVNIPLDYFLIFGLPSWPLPGFDGMAGFGIAGAGYATVAGAALNFLLLAIFIFTPRNERKYHVWSGRRPDFALLGRILRYGLPSGLNSFMDALTGTIFVFVAGRLGSLALAATNITFSINGVAFVPTLGINISASILVGQALGQRRPDRAVRATVSSLHIALAYMSLMALLFVTCPRFLFGLFEPGGIDASAASALASAGVVLLRYVAFYSIMDAVSLVFFGALKGAGDTWFIMWVMCGACLCIFGGTEAAGWYFPGSLDALWVIATAVATALAVCAALRFYYGPWRSLSLIRQTDKTPASREKDGQP